MAPEFLYLILWIIAKSLDICQTERTGGDEWNGGWLSEPADRAVSKNSRVEWQCRAPQLYGHQPWQYTWYRDGEEVERRSGTDVDSASGLLTIGRVRHRENRTDAGVYYCVAANGVGSIRSHSATLSIAYLERFTVEPVDTAGHVGDIVQLTCHIRGLPQPSITWSRNNQPLPHNSKYATLPSGNLLIASLTASDAGVYRCHASNSVRNRTSQRATLTVLDTVVNDGPTILALPQDTIVSAGDELILPCAASGNPLPQAQWQFPECIQPKYDEDDLYDDEALQRDSQPIRKQACDDGGHMVLACPARSTIHVIYANYGRTQPGAQVCPHDTLDTSATNCESPGSLPAVQAICEDKRECHVPSNGFLDDPCPGTHKYTSVTYFCLCEGRSKNDRARRRRPEGVAEELGWLDIASVQPKHAGTYTCDVAGGSRTATLSVMEPPRLNRSVSNHRIHKSVLVRLSCCYYGTPKPHVTWLKNNQVVQSSEHMTLKETPPPDANGYCHELKVDKSEDADSGLYQCLVANAAGRKANIFAVEIFQHEESPEAPRNLHVQTVSDTWVTLQWDPSISELPVVGYSVHYIPTDGRVAELQIVSEFNSTNCKLENLTPYTNYSVYVMTYNTRGISTDHTSNNIYFRTRQAACKRAPATELVGNAGVITVSWDPLPAQDARGQVMQWKVEYRAHLSNVLDGTMTVPGNDYKARITGLEAGHKYDVRVICSTGAGFPENLNDDYFPWTSYKIPEETTTGLHMTPGVDSLTVWWRPVGPYAVQECRLLFYHGPQFEQHSEYTLPGNQSRMVIPNLEPDTQYRVELTVSLSDGPSNFEQSFEKSDWTLPRPTIPRPDTPYLVSAFDQGPTSIAVRWRSDIRATYRVKYTPVVVVAGKQTFNHSQARQLVVEEVKTVNITGLEPHSVYEVAVQAIKDNRTSVWSTPTKHVTEESKPSAPLHFNVVAQSPGRIEVKWVAPEKENGIILNYTIYYRPQSSNGSWANVTVNAPKTMCLLTGLVEDEVYALAVCAATSKGLGELSPQLQAKAGVVLATPVPPPGNKLQLLLWTVIVTSCVLIIIIILLVILCKSRSSRRAQHQDMCRKYGCSKACGPQHVHCEHHGMLPSNTYPSSNGQAGLCLHSNGYPGHPLTEHVPMLANHGPDHHIDSKGGKSPSDGRVKNGCVPRAHHPIANGEAHTLLAGDSDQEETGFAAKQVAPSESNTTGETLLSRHKDFNPDHIDYDGRHLDGRDPDEQYDGGSFSSDPPDEGDRPPTPPPPLDTDELWGTAAQGQVPPMGSTEDVARSSSNQNTSLHGDAGPRDPSSPPTSASRDVDHVGDYSLRDVGQSGSKNRSSRDPHALPTSAHVPAETARASPATSSKSPPPLTSATPPHRAAMASLAGETEHLSKHSPTHRHASTPPHRNPGRHEPPQRHKRPSPPPPHRNGFTRPSREAGQHVISNGHVLPGYDMNHVLS